MFGTVVDCVSLRPAYVVHRTSAVFCSSATYGGDVWVAHLHYLQVSLPTFDTLPTSSDSQ